MSRSRKQSLLAAVLAQSFRPDRQGRLLLSERLPERLPVPGNERAREAWAGIVQAQARYRENGAADTYGFSRLVRALHRELAASEIPSLERFVILDCLAFGPWRVTSPAGPVGEPLRSDEELHAHWEGWAKLEQPSPAREWGEADWAVQRFEKGLDAVEAFHAAATEGEHRREQRTLHTIREA